MGPELTKHSGSYLFLWGKKPRSSNATLMADSPEPVFRNAPL